MSKASSPPRTSRSALLVAIGIFLSRIAGFARGRAQAHYLGLAMEADAFNQALKIPNFLQNLFGEGALSASFIPVYASLLAKGDRREADRIAGAVVSLLALIISVLVLAGMAATPFFINAIAPGFVGEKRDLTIHLVRILFPGTGLLVLSAWCLGVLNSHHKFLLSYTAPVVWNVAIIATMIHYGSASLSRLAVYLAWGAVVGSALQLAVQLPVVFRLAPNLKFALDTASEQVRAVIRTFVPAFVGRGVVQLSAYIDSVIASYLPTGAVTALLNAQSLYLLPVSLFGMSISAAELPAMSSSLGVDPQGSEKIRNRLNFGLRQIAFFVVPSVMAFLALGGVIAAGLFEGGLFRHTDSVYVWGILAGSGVGLLASTLGRLYSSTYYAMRDTRTPLRYALVRVGLTTALGYLFAFPLPRALHLSSIWGAAGLTASAGIAGWVEMLMLRRTLNSRIGHTGLPFDYVAKLWVAAIAGAAVAWLVKLALPAKLYPPFAAVLILSPYGAVFIGATFLLRIPEASGAISRLRRRA